MKQKKTTQIFYLDRDTNIEKLVGDMVRWVQRQSGNLSIHKQDLQPDPLAFRSITMSMDVVNKELSRLHAFFRGAVVKCYWMQSRDIYDPNYNMSSDDMREAVYEIKEGTRFYLYTWKGTVEKDVKGRPILNSMAVFTDTKSFNEQLTIIQESLFDDQGYYFPDSERYKENLKEHGEKIANEYEVKMMLEHYKKRTNIKEEESYPLTPTRKVKKKRHTKSKA